MSDTLGKLGDFVRAGQAAQAAVDKITRPSAADMAIDAMGLGRQIGAVIRLLDDAAAHRAHRRHTNATSLEQLARKEIRQFAGALAAHLQRFAEPPALVIYRCTCGYEYRNPEPPASIKCRDCGGVAVNVKA